MDSIPRLNLTLEDMFNHNEWVTLTEFEVKLQHCVVLFHIDYNFALERFRVGHIRYAINSQLEE